MLSDNPHKDMPVEYHVLRFELLLVSVLVDEPRIQLSLLLRGEPVDFYLFGKVHLVLGHPFEDGFLRAPLDCKLFVPSVLVDVLYLLLGKRLFLYGREIPVQ